MRGPTVSIIYHVRWVSLRTASFGWPQSSLWSLGWRFPWLMLSMISFCTVSCIMMGVVLAWSMLPWPVRVGSSVGAQVGVRQIVKTIESAHVWSQAHPVNLRRVRWVSIFWVWPWVPGHVLMMVWRGWQISCTSISGIVTVARIVCGIGGVDCAVTSWTVHFQLAILALLGDGVHLGEENCRQKDTTNNYNTDSICRIMEVDRSKVVDYGPSC